MVQLVAVGDAMVGSRNLAMRLGNELVGMLGSTDASFVNAEFVCASESAAPISPPKTWRVSADEWALDELIDLGFNLFSFANNQIGHFGPEGVSDTLDAADRRSIIHAGAGRTLTEARRPAFQDTSNGRVALIAVDSTRAVQMLASDPGDRVAARAGLNPLRCKESLVLPPDEFQELQRIDELLGTKAQSELWDAHEVKVVGNCDTTKTFSFCGKKIELGDHAYVRTLVEPEDIDAIVASVRDASLRAEHVVVSMHCHEGIDGGWYSSRPADFVVDAAHRIIDAGASAILGHGPHMMRGIEFYQGKPVLYSLGNFIFDLEMMSRVAPECYPGFGLPPDSAPSALHNFRRMDAQGNLRGFYLHEEIWQSCVARLDLGAEHPSVQLSPISLQMSSECPSERGIPKIAQDDEAGRIAERLANMSEPFGTEIVERGDGTFQARPRAQEG